MTTSRFGAVPLDVSDRTWLAEENDGSGPLAVTRLGPARGAALAVMRRTAAQARSLVRQRFPDIRHSFDVRREDAELLLVMDPLTGPSLTDVMASANLSVATVAEVVAQIAETLSIAHSVGLAHGAVCPDNIVVEQGGHARLADSDTGDERYVSSSGVPLSPSRDVWAMGAVLYAALEGHPPAAFGAGRPGSVGPFAALITAMLEDDPIRRPVAAEVAQQLRATMPSPDGFSRPVLFSKATSASQPTLPAPVNGAAPVVRAADADATATRVRPTVVGASPWAPAGPSLPTRAAPYPMPVREDPPPNRRRILLVAAAAVVCLAAAVAAIAATRSDNHTAGAAARTTHTGTTAAARTSATSSATSTVGAVTTTTPAAPVPTPHLATGAHTCVGRTCTFGVGASGLGVDGAVTWHFGDGSAASGTAAIKHTYKLPGHYVVTVTGRHDGRAFTAAGGTVSIVGRTPALTVRPGAAGAQSLLVTYSGGSTCPRAAYTILTPSGAPVARGQLTAATSRLSVPRAGTFRVVLAEADHANTVCARVSSRTVAVAPAPVTQTQTTTQAPPPATSSSTPAPQTSSHTTQPTSPPATTHTTPPSKPTKTPPPFYGNG